MRLHLLYLLILLNSTLLAHNGQLEYYTDSLYLLLEKPLPKAQKIETLQKALNTGPSWTLTLSYLEALESYNDIWNTPSFQKYHIYKKAAQHMIDGNLEDGLNFMKQFIEACDQEKIIMGMDSPLSRIRYIYRSLDRHKEGYEYYSEKLRYYEENGPPENKGMSLHGIGGYYNFTGNNNKAIEYYLKAAEIFEGHPFCYGTELAVVGSLYQQWGNTKKAIEYSNKSLPYLTKARDYPTLCFASNTLVKVYKQEKAYDKALKTALNTLEQLKNITPFQTTTFLEVGDLYVRLNETNKALPYLKRAEHLGDSLQMSIANRAGLYEIDFTYYKYYNSISNFDLAEQYLLEALRKANHGNIHALRQKYLKELTIFYKTQKDFKYATQFAELQMTLSDSLSRSRNADVVADYELEQNETRAKLETQKVNQKRKSQVRNLSIAGGFFLLLAGGFFYRMRYIQKIKAAIEKEKNRSEELLLNILPYEVAEELKSKGKVAAKEYKAVTILLSDFKEFTQAAEVMTAHDLIKEINVCFKAFDHIMEKYEIEKIKTMGDAYMSASGLQGTPEASAKVAVLAALEMQTFVYNRTAETQKEYNRTFEMRIGIHTGPVIAGVVGVKKFQYDLWGDTVNSAARIESSGDVNKVNISEATYQLIKDHSEFSFEHRGSLDVKGKGSMNMYFVSLVD